MIYLISDLHGEHQFRGLEDYLRDGKEDDLLIILGDLMLGFDHSEQNRAFTEYMLSLRKPIAFLDGNHENFAYLHSFPEEDWNGGRVHRLSEHMVHLMRGYVYDIQGHSFFVMGGCKSSPKWKEMGLWHEGDEPSAEELARGYRALAARENRVDYILTHKYEAFPPAGTVTQGLLDFTAFADAQVSYQTWFSGHWHKNARRDRKHVYVYDALTPIE